MIAKEQDCKKNNTASFKVSELVPRNGKVTPISEQINTLWFKGTFI